MGSEPDRIELNSDDLRAVAGFAASCAREVLVVVEGDHPDDARARQAVDAADQVAGGRARSALQRSAAWAALRAARDVSTPAAREAALAAMCAAGSAYLHPLADGRQVTHILGAGAHAARAVELVAVDDRDVGWAHLHAIAERAPADLRDVLVRYPSPPAGGGRGGELMRALATALRP